MQGLDAAPLSTPEVVKLGLAVSDPLATEALELFTKWFGRFAGDVALLYGASGGVYLGGGIAPQIRELLRNGPFRTAFLANGRLAQYLEQMPVYVIKSREAGLEGAAVALSQTVPSI